MSADRARWLMLAVAGVVLVAHSLVYNFVTDDAYISFVFSRNLAEHGQLTFNAGAGHPVEGYTNFSWTVILGLLMIIGVSPEWSSRVLGTVCALGTLYLVFRVVERALGRRTPWAAVAPLLLACSSGFACWTSGGLETQLFTLLVVAALDGFVDRPASPSGDAARRGQAPPGGRPASPSGDAARRGQAPPGGRPASPSGDAARRGQAPPGGQPASPSGDAARRGQAPPGGGSLRRMALALALAAMTRPEGLLVAAVLAIALVAGNALQRRVRPNRAELIAAAWFLGLWAPWFAWRCWYYGWLFPNTYYVKAHGPWASPGLAHEMWSNGAYYVWAWLRQTRLIWALPIAIVGLCASPLRWQRLAIAGGCAVVVALCVAPFASLGGSFWEARAVWAALGAVVGLTFAAPRTPRLALTSASALIAAVYLVYAISVGGDFMGLHRFIMPVFALAAIAVALGLEWLVDVLVPPARRSLAAVIACTVVIGAFAITQALLTRDSVRAGNWDADHGIDTPAYLKVYTADRAAIGAAMAPCFRDDDFSVVGGAGAQPYFGRMRAIDVFGLVSEAIAHDEPRIRARAGHTKWGNDNLLATYDPTFVFSCYELSATADPQPRLPCAGFWLGRGYEKVTMRIPGLHERGEYYTFLAKQTRAFSCPGRVH